jgi:uncharacterized protein
MDRKITVTPDLIQLERNGQLLLMDGKTIKPLLVKEGAETIKAYLEACRRCQTDEELSRSYNDPLLLQALVDHGLIGYEPKNGGGAPSPCEPAKQCGPDKRQRMANEQKQRLSLYLLLTQYCNLGCIYCLNGVESYQKKSLPRMKEKVAFHTVEKFLQDLAPGGTLEIVFFGGEPLLNWPLAKKIITFCENELKTKYSDRTWKYHFTTNLTVFPNDLIDWAKRYDITFLVDVDGPERVHNLTRPARHPKLNSFKRTVNNLKKLVRAGIRPSMRTTVTSHNVDYMVETSHLHKELGASGSAFVPITPVNSDEFIMPSEWYPEPQKFVNNLIAIIESKIWELEEIFPVNEIARCITPGRCASIACGAPFGNTPTVDINGDVYACIYLVGIKRYLIGNVFDGEYPRKDVLDSMARLANVHNVESCMRCSYRYMCSGGCPVTRYTVADNPNAGTDTLQYAGEKTCIMKTSIIQHLLWQLAADAVNSSCMDSESEQSICI